MQNHLNSHTLEMIYAKEKTLDPVRLLVYSTIVIFGLETLVMYVLDYIVTLPRLLDVLLDGIILVVCLFPLNYYFIVRPMAERIEKHRKTSLDLHKSNEVLERFFSVSGVLIAYLDADFNFIKVNEAYAATDQRPADDFIGKNHFDLFPNAENQAIFENVVRTGKPFFITEKPFEYVGHPERGVSYWDWSLMPVKDPNNKVIALIFVLTDVTQRRHAQLALAESERRFRAVFNQTFQHMGLLNPNGTIMLLNQTMLDFLGVPEDEMVGKNFWQIPCWLTSFVSKKDTAEQIQLAIHQAAAGKVVRSELQVKSCEGEKLIMDITFKPLLDEQGRTRRILYEARDISERIRAEEALVANEKEIQRLYQAEMNAHEHADILRSAVQALSGSLNISTVLEILLDYIYKVVPFSGAHILLLEDEDHLIVRSARGEENWNSDGRLLNERFNVSEYPFFTKVLEERQVLCISDTLIDAQYNYFQDDPLVLSWVAIPLQAGDQVIGMCVLGHRCPGFFQQELTQWAVTITRQASVAIHNAWLFEQVRENREHLQALSRRLVEVQESERHYIARELHDEAGQALASLMFGLHGLELDSADQAAVIEHCHELKQVTEGVLGNLHRLAVNLRPATLDHLGLVAALRQHAETMSIQHNLAIQYETIGRIDRLPGEMETAIYRIVQEALTNVIRHAHATWVDILLEHRDNNLVVVVEDNGVGFDPQVPKISQLGILGMRDRADMMGGTITIESSPGKGSTVVLEVPCPSES